jgi:GAF domain-containing protein
LCYRWIMDPGSLIPSEPLKLSLYMHEVGELLAVQRAFSSCLEPEAVLQIIADEARRLTSVEMSAVYCFVQDHLEIGAVSGSLRKNLLGHSVPVEGSLAGRVIQVSQALLVSDIQNSALVYSPLIENFNARSFLVLPLPSPAEPLGAVLLASRIPGRLGQDELQVLELILPAASTALVNARHFVRAQKMAAIEERRRLSSRLQSMAAQTLFSASLIADILPRLVEMDPEEGRSRMEELREITRKALVEMRSLVFDDHH